MDFSNIKILVVDDEPDLAELTVESFQDEGFTVLQAASGEEAIKIFNKEDVSLIFSDSIMPGMNGEDLLEEVSKSGKKMPHFYLVTGKVDIEVEKLKEMGLTDVIAKPYDLDEVIADIKKLFQ